jgi:hypothetical protein
MKEVASANGTLITQYNYDDTERLLSEKNFKGEKNRMEPGHFIMKEQKH